MNERKHIVAICGSQADDSKTRLALRHALDAAERQGAATELIDLRDLELPTFDADRRDTGDAPALREAVRTADAVILGTPMYHGSYASPLKTALDYCRIDDFEGTTVGLLAVAGGSFPTPALNHLRAVCRALKAWVLPHQVVVPNSYEQFDGRELRDDDLEARIVDFGHAVVRYAGVEEYPEVKSTQQAVAVCD